MNNKEKFLKIKSDFLSLLQEMSEQEAINVCEDFIDTLETQADALREQVNSDE